ncbi:MAG: DEAD/DEAH box helicase family protein [Acidimicrobiaceae bacterium]|nr:DEAD/DEAH box helicase family protein [Acidimicrobiaceae bacterium]MCY4280065.1 DEAD/DEAH box helicase family protein [Acidimicrobiaceae bacterium]MCY4294555.1 DEAD/DEAH box helicase family protein [Acidimicrobiaceae bacterium]
MNSDPTKLGVSEGVRLDTKSRRLALPDEAQDKATDEVPDHIRQPVLNRPHEEPSRHWQLSSDNTSTGRAMDGRRLSQALVIVPKQRGAQQRIQETPAEQNELVNRIRDAVAGWRRANYPDATAATRQLLLHWRSEANEPRLFFAQVEAAETLIWLTEANAGRFPVLADIRRELAEANRDYNDGIDRLAVRMATGSGKTAVMGMVIAWHAANAAASQRRDGRYTTSFLAIAPGHTVRERLAVLDPANPDNVYDEMGLLPRSMSGALGAVKVRVLNFQALQRRDRLSAVSSDARKLLRSGRKASDPESMSAVLHRALRGLPAGRGAPKVCVLNDEAHHCYLPEAGRRTSEDDDTKAAAVWFAALEGLRDTGRLGPVYDFSATPIFIEGAERRERMFGWVVSDFPLMDSIESGLVKVPQVPVDDDSADERVRWRNLYANTTPKKVERDSVPAELKQALAALYRSYEQKFDLWMHPDPPAEPMPTPPVFIVVANNISNATALADHIAGWAEKRPDGTFVHHQGACELFANYSSDGPTERIRTLLVHSQLEGEGSLSAPIKAQAKRLRLLDDARGDRDSRDDRDVVRAALNSVGRIGGLGEHIRCVVSVSMLTEGWDTRTVTHILGYRAFSTQLLCEQVTGRALRRSNYDNFDDDGRLVAEYAEVIGVPFEFMQVKRSDDESAPPKDRYEVRSVAGRREHRIEFPDVEQYLTEPGADGFRLDPQRVIRWVPKGAKNTELKGSVGAPVIISAAADMRRQQAVTRVAAGLVARWTQRITEGAGDGDGRRARRRLLFHEAVKIVKAWTLLAGVGEAHYDGLGSSSLEQAVKEIDDACEATGGVQDRLVAAFGKPMLLDTSGVGFETSLSPRHRTKKSELNFAACHSKLEAACARALDKHPDVVSWARNFRLGWTVPYLWEGAWHRYEPDFVARLFAPGGDADAVHLIIECKGAPDDRSERKKQSVTTRWIPAVQASPRLPGWLRRWSFVELDQRESLSMDLEEAVRQARKTHPPRLQEEAA